MASLELCFDRKSWDVQTKVKAGVPAIPFVMFLLVCRFCFGAVAIVEKSVFEAALFLLGADLEIVFMLSILQQNDYSSEIFLNSTSQHHKVTINVSSILWQQMGIFCLSLVSFLSAALMMEKNVILTAWLFIMTARSSMAIARIWLLPINIVNSIEFQWISWWIEVKFENSLNDWRLLQAGEDNSEVDSWEIDSDGGHRKSD